MSHDRSDGSDRPELFGVSVIIPARNAATTLAETLDSLLLQTHRSWRATVIDDGSTDDTASIAQAYAERDERIGVLSGPGRGVSAARNAGLAVARMPWVLFLDADDTILPEMLTRMTAALSANPRADAVHCGWILSDMQGTPFGSKRCEETSSDLFRSFASYCAFSIHACVVRRTQIEKAGGFDETLRISEDLDFWQRVSRVGTYFIGIPDLLSVYRLRPDASWFQPDVFLHDVMRVARRSHAPDPRLADTLVPIKHRNGAPLSELSAVETKMVIWAGAMAIAREEDPVPFLDRISYRADGLDPGTIAGILFEAMLFALRQPAADWQQLLPRFGPALGRFLEGVEQRSSLPSLGLRTQRALEAAIAAAVLAEDRNAQATVIIGKTACIAIEVAGPLEDVLLPNVERAICVARVGGRTLGSVNLPVADGVVPALVIADAIAGRFAWPLLETFFEVQQIYAQVSIVRDEAGWTVNRGALALASFTADPSAALHDRVGWGILLQELFARPDKTSADFYASTDLEAEPPQRTAELENIVELTQPIPAIVEAPGDTILVRATAGGAPVTVARIPVREGVASEAEIRLALLERSRMELARTAVREAIVGHALADPRSLNQRLRDAAEARGTDYAGSLLSAGGAADVLGSTRPVRTEEIARRLALPRAKASLMLESAQAGQPVLGFSGNPAGGESAAAQLLFLPELLPAPEEPGTQNASTAAGEDPESASVSESVYGRHFFETLFANDADPWQYGSGYEQTKYEQTLSMLPRGRIHQALEIGSAEGHFTAQLAPRVRSLTVSDISNIALDRTAKRCAGRSNLTFRQLDLVRDEIPGTYDLIVCSEMLYYLGDHAALVSASRKLLAALRPGGYLVMAHANLVIDDPHTTGFDWELYFGARRIGETFAAIRELEFDKELQTPLYRVQRFRRRRLPRLRRGSDPVVQQPRSVEIARHSEPEPEVAKHIFWSGGQVTEVENAVSTFHLPILMYHLVAESGPSRLARWRVSPEMFAAHMRYLKQAGFTPATLDEWRIARREKKPLPGRRVLITFDDGYADFETLALPALRENGFSAVMFLPTDRVGDCARWDGADGERLALMDWDAVRRIQAAGVVIGSHSGSHPYLTTLTMEDLVDELCRSRLAIERELGGPVDAIAYPFGDCDEAVARVAAACGYVFGLTTQDGMSGLGEDGLNLSRIEVLGQQTLEQFIAILARFQPPESSS